MMHTQIAMNTIDLLIFLQRLQVACHTVVMYVHCPSVHVYFIFAVTSMQPVADPVWGGKRYTLIMHAPEL